MSLFGNNGQHVAERESWWARRSRKGKVAILVAGFLTIAGVAWAVFIASIGMNSGTFEFTIDPQADVTISTIESFSGCADGASIAADGKSFSIDSWPSFAPGDNCTVRFNVNIANSNTDIYATDLVIADSLVTGVIPTGTAGNGDVCGDLLANGDTVRLEFAVNSVSAAGTYSWSMGAGDQLVFSSDPADGDCTSAT